MTTQTSLFDQELCPQCKHLYGTRAYLDGMWCDACVIAHQEGVIRTLKDTIAQGGGLIANARGVIARTLASEGSACQCPVCDQRVQAYRRRPHTSMCRFLAELVRIWAGREHDWEADPRGPWVHRNEVGHVANDYSYLARFGAVDGDDVGESMEPVEGLIEALPGEPGKVKPGWWRPTPTALRWMRGEVKVRAWVEIYNGSIVWRAPDGVSFTEALGEAFDLDDAMGAARAAAARA